MSDAFFKPRRELLDWLKQDFECNIQKLEECANGAMYLHIFDKAYPGKVPMQKVHWGAVQEYEMTKNYKLLQEVFKDCGLNRSFEIAKLTKGRQQDNLEFLQWIKYVYDRRMEQNPVEDYKPMERRLLGHGPLPDWAAFGFRSRGQPTPGASSSVMHKREASSGMRNHHGTSSSRQPTFAKPVSSGLARKPSGQMPKAHPRLSAENQRLDEIERELKELNNRYDEAFTSKEFFLNKLKALEVLCMRDSASETVDRSTILDILYSEHLVEIKMEPLNDLKENQIGESS
eukprot:Gregarina_sp_Poly_1__7095@NODE_387_length_8987_cov_450_884305_g316_i0_p4_GENE_NODE_387_length_8987_cov_450_884305_g316_i0NODE_387_length_8987_cov_450_884305_g316_i0_p4_ORF_typecomplete_len287_score41_33CH/PF00307_31/5_5e05CH/PF00307_31/5_4e02CH_2/PF06294_11/0_00048DUF5446/PF17522_2/5_7e03DUF5446/PF17522_2/0_072MT/PF12777_7/0_048EB1/PF03271_17/9_8e03EB1/PF03271_17/1_7e04EB1/PF03271_17/1_4e04EB1/PF03271_17/0_036Uds1/PF15456_6/0_074HR1/PF02185_16/1_7e03HR1/PF02185_16/0_38DUF446/PF04287_12/1_5DUF446